MSRSRHVRVDTFPVTRIQCFEWRVFREQRVFEITNRFTTIDSFRKIFSRAVGKIDLFPNLESITIVRNIFFLCYYISSENRLVYANGVRELHGIRFKIIARLEKKKKNVSLKEI